MIEPKNSYYEILGCHRGSPMVEIQGAWKSLSRATHPDALIGKPVLEVEQATNKFLRLTEAYAVLGNTIARLAYEARIDATGDPCSACGGRGFLTKQKSYTEAAKISCLRCRASGRVLRDRVQPPESKLGSAK